MKSVLNTNLKAENATTQYLCPDIDSMVKFNSEYLAAGETGLYHYSGDLDNTSAIQAYFVTATMDFGVNNDKRLRYVYLSLESTDDLQLIVNTEKVAAITYTISVDTTIGQQDVRIPISRALHGRFWTFKISNDTTGADFSIDEIKILPIVRTWAH